MRRPLAILAASVVLAACGGGGGGTQPSDGPTASNTAGEPSEPADDETIAPPSDPASAPTSDDASAPASEGEAVAIEDMCTFVTDETAAEAVGSDVDPGQPFGYVGCTWSAGNSHVVVQLLSGDLYDPAAEGELIDGPAGVTVYIHDPGPGVVADIPGADSLAVAVWPSGQGGMSREASINLLTELVDRL